MSRVPLCQPAEQLLPVTAFCILCSKDDWQSLYSDFFSTGWSQDESPSLQQHSKFVSCCSLSEMWRIRDNILVLFEILREKTPVCGVGLNQELQACQCLKQQCCNMFAETIARLLTALKLKQWVISLTDRLCCWVFTLQTSFLTAAQSVASSLKLRRSTCCCNMDVGAWGAEGSAAASQTSRWHTPNLQEGPND